MRLPYVSDPPTFPDAESQAIVDEIRERRIKGGHGGLVELDKALLHSVPVAAGWNTFLGAIRTQTKLSPLIRELIICRVAALNGAAYEWGHHAPLLRAAAGEDDSLLKSSGDATAAAEAILVIIAEGEPTALQNLETPLGLSREFIRRAQAVLNFVDESTKQVKVSQGTWDELRSVCKDGEEGDRQAVEVTATCAAYNCVSRFLVALDVGEANTP